MVDVKLKFLILNIALLEYLLLLTIDEKLFVDRNSCYTNSFEWNSAKLVVLLFGQIYLLFQRYLELK